MTAKSKYVKTIKGECIFILQILFNIIIICIKLHNASKKINGLRDKSLDTFENIKTKGAEIK